MGERGPMPGHAYGAAAITHALHGVDFPMSKSDILKHYGNKDIEFKKGHHCKLSDIIKDLPEQTFNSPADLEHSIHEKMAA